MRNITVGLVISLCFTILICKGCKQTKHPDKISIPSNKSSSSGWASVFDVYMKDNKAHLESVAPFSEVIVPLKIKHDVPYITVSWGGKELECKLDTGSNEIIWPLYLQLKSRPIGVIRSIQWLSGALTTCELRMTRRISIGNHTLENIPTLAYQTQNQVSLPEKQSSVPIIGMMAFQKVVVTIDNKKSQLILRDKQYDLSKSSTSSRNQIFGFGTKYDGRVYMDGMISGHPARYVLDSACDSMLISSEFARKNLKTERIMATKHPEGSSVSYGWDAVRRPQCMLLGKKFSPPLIDTMDHMTGVDALIGGPLFRAREITIDQGRGLVRFTSHRK